jgi:hypothetical protein
LRTVGDVVRFPNWKSIHVGPQRHRATGPGLQLSDTAGNADSGPHRIAQALQPVGDERGGSCLLEREFRVGMDLAPDLHEIRGERGGLGQQLDSPP